jgi:signal transduction histidine kinase
VPVAERAALAALAGIATLSLAWRRVRPDASALVCMTFVVADTQLGMFDTLWPVAVVPLALYSAARHASTRGAFAALALGVLFDILLDFDETSDSVGEFLLNFLFILVTLVGVPWAAGYALRLRARESERREVAAVTDERRRMAREIHDVVGHALGVIVVQAGAERATLAPDAAASTFETLTLIERTGRDALVEMRLLVDLMNPDHDSGRYPHPGLAQLDTLVRDVHAAGLPTELRIEGQPVTLPAGLDLSAYRVVQEALTNALRHAGPAHAEVALRFLPSALQIVVTDDGSRRDVASSSPGRGLSGMRERVALYGGSMSSGPRPEGGFAVQVRLPVDGQP